MKKYGFYVMIFILLLLITIIVIYKRPLKVYSRDIYKMDTYINIKIYSNDEEKSIKALDEVEKIYNDYHVLTDRYNSYDGVFNIYYINNNIDKSNSITLDSRLYDLISYGIDWYYKSNGIKNINLGNIIDVWKKYRDVGEGIPTNEELKAAGSTNITNIKLLENNQILNNHPNIDLGSIAKGYATEVSGEYLKSIGLDKFIINAGGNVLVGDHYASSKYKIGIKDPVNNNEVFTVVRGNNIAVVTSGSYERYYEYNGQIYGHIIDPNTLFPANKYKSVTVVCNDSALGDSLSLVLFVMDIDEGEKLLKNFDNVEAIWYGNDGKITRSSGFSVYE